MTVRPAKTQISLGIRPVWSESSLCVQWVAEDPIFLHADSEDSDQTGRMPKLIWVFAGRSHFVGFVMRRLICPIEPSKDRPHIWLQSSPIHALVSALWVYSWPVLVELGHPEAFNIAALCTLSNSVTHSSWLRACTAAAYSNKGTIRVLYNLKKMDCGHPLKSFLKISSALP